MPAPRYRLRLDRLRTVLERSRLSQNHWALKLGLSRGHWSDLVHGRHPYPSAKTRERLVEVVGLPFEELFEEETGPPDTESAFKAALRDRYLVDSEVGRGGMGVVYLARDLRHGRQVAVKMVSPEAVGGIGPEQFLKEIRYTAQLQHHHILPLFDSGLAAECPFYVMPYVKGGSLKDLLKRESALSLDRALGLLKGMASALSAAHTAQVLHCDIKPANVLLSDDHPFMADFGIARAIHRESFEWGARRDLDSSAGTPAYVSPEQATGEPNLDARSDGVQPGLRGLRDAHRPAALRRRHHDADRGPALHGRHPGSGRRQPRRAPRPVRQDPGRHVASAPQAADLDRRVRRGTGRGPSRRQGRAGGDGETDPRRPASHPQGRPRPGRHAARGLRSPSGGSTGCWRLPRATSRASIRPRWTSPPWASPCCSPSRPASPSGWCRRWGSRATTRAG